MKKIIEVKNLVKKYNSFAAVDNISFNVNEGEIFGLLGPNGAGKSTTLEILETLINKTSGNILIDNLDLDKETIKIKKIIGVQLQSNGFYPNLNLSELLDLFAGLYNTKIDKLELLKKVNLEDKIKINYSKLSGGQKQRFAIATALINNPKILFLDEPTTGLDPQARRNLWELVKTINQLNITIILTTHYMEEAEYLCNNIGIMDKGKLITLGTSKQLIDNLLETGFTKNIKNNKANLEDVFINLTGLNLKEN